MTTAQDGGKVVSVTHRPLLPPRYVPGTGTGTGTGTFLLEAQLIPEA